MNNHYYILPDGMKVDNMKDAMKALKCTRGMFKYMRDMGIVKRIEVANSDEELNSLEDERRI